ncbi:MAG: sugar transferase [Cytophagales bacterium]|nr:MAG: sugar transferase [Cytophagales bacterium]
MYNKLIKPALDRLLALIGLLTLWPLLLLIALASAVSTRSNPLFRQQRMGQHGRLFCLFKLRTMTNNRDACGNLLPDADRLTSTGKWLRQTSLDELPQLVNVLLGQMSLVGPRPLLATYAVTLLYHERHIVRPGITGWAQVHGRNSLSWEQKFALDSWYVRHVSFRTDCSILWRTLFVLIDSSPSATPLSPCFSTEPEATPVSSSAF